MTLPLWDQDFMQIFKAVSSVQWSIQKFRTTFHECCEFGCAPVFMNEAQRLYPAIFESSCVVPGRSWKISSYLAATLAPTNSLMSLWSGLKKAPLWRFPVWHWEGGTGHSLPLLSSPCFMSQFLSLSAIFKHLFLSILAAVKPINWAHPPPNCCTPLNPLLVSVSTLLR